MDRKEALDRLAAIEKETAELRKIIDAPEVDYSAWIGKYGFVSDDNPACPDDGVTMKLDSYDSGAQLPFCVGESCFWRHFRPATLTELGFPELDSARDYVDWSKVPEEVNCVVVNRDGTIHFGEGLEERPFTTSGGWQISGIGVWGRDNIDADHAAIICPLPPWRESLRMRPEAAK